MNTRDLDTVSIRSQIRVEVVMAFSTKAADLAHRTTVAVLVGGSLYGIVVLGMLFRNTRARRREGERMMMAGEQPPHRD